MMTKRNDGMIGVQDTDLAPPSSFSSSQTEKPFDAKHALLELMELAASARHALQIVISGCDSAKIGIFSSERDALARLSKKLDELGTAVGPRVHVLKTDPVPFALVKNRLKKYEVRKFDRPFRVGDEVKLLEFDRETQEYSGAWIRAKIVAVTRPGEYGLAEDNMIGVLGIEVIATGETKLPIRAAFGVVS